jgi:hypothetical protein
MKRIKMTKAEREAWWNAREARIRQLRELVAKGEAELAEKRRRTSA